MNIEKTVVDWLNTSPAIQPVRAAVSVPENMNTTHTGTFITVERTGGQEEVFTSQAILAIQAWAPTRWAASELADKVIDRLKAIVKLPNVIDIDISGITNFPTETGWPRYQIVADITTQIEQNPPTPL